MNKIIVDKARLLRRAIIISWITLALCFVVKIFGSNFFEIMCENPNYKALCEYADSHFWLKYILMALSSLLCQALYILAILQKYKFTTKQFLIMLVSVLVNAYIKEYYPFISFIFDFWLTLFLPMIFLGKNFKKYWNIPIGIILILSFQFLSLVAKNISIGRIDNSTFISLIYGIDVYIMCFLYYLYRNFQKENKNMGGFWVFFMGKPDDKLVAMKEKREKKIAKLKEKETKFQSEVNAIEIELSKRKNKK